MHDDIHIDQRFGHRLRISYVAENRIDAQAFRIVERRNIERSDAMTAREEVSAKIDAEKPGATRNQEQL
jgi:hypothetical protein